MSPALATAQQFGAQQSLEVEEARDHFMQEQRPALRRSVHSHPEHDVAPLNVWGRRTLSQSSWSCSGDLSGSSINVASSS